MLGGTHTEIGGYILELWGLPDLVVEAISYHNYPSACPEDKYSMVETIDFTALTATHVANYVCGNQDVISGAQAQTELDNIYLEQIQMADRLDAWWDVCMQSG